MPWGILWNHDADKPNMRIIVLTLELILEIRRINSKNSQLFETWYDKNIDVYFSHSVETEDLQPNNVATSISKGLFHIGAFGKYEKKILDENYWSKCGRKFIM